MMEIHASLDNVLSRICVENSFVQKSLGGFYRMLVFRLALGVTFMLTPLLQSFALLWSFVIRRLSHLLLRLAFVPLFLGLTGVCYFFWSMLLGDVIWL